MKNSKNNMIRVFNYLTNNAFGFALFLIKGVIIVLAIIGIWFLFAINVFNEAFAQTPHEYFNEPVFVTAPLYKRTVETMKSKVALKRTVLDIPAPAGYWRAYWDEYSLNMGRLPLKITSNGTANQKAVFTYDGQYSGKASYVIDMDVERYQDCAGTAMLVHAIMMEDYNIVHDANGKSYSINPVGGNNPEMGMCGSYSINKYDVHGLHPIDSVIPGDLFIYGNFPGHVAIVLDVVKNELGDKQIMIGQGWLPARDFHIVWDMDPTDVWFSVNEIKKFGYVQLNTEYLYYDFEVNELKRWKNR